MQESATLCTGPVQAGCGADTTAPTATLVAGAAAAGGNGSPMAKFSLQLKWLNQAQFAGYYVALDKGYYKAVNLDVTLLPGGPDVVPSQKVLTGAADAGIDWVGSLLANRDKGQPLVDVAQFYQSSGLLLISKKTAGINSPADLKGKKVGVWTGGNEFEFRALMDQYHFDNSIDNNKDMTVIKQGFEMDTFLNYNDEGVGMLEDHVFVTEQTLQSKRDILTRFLAASQKGWMDAVKDQPNAVASTMARVDKSTTTEAHQTTMMKEVAKLVQPAGLTADKIGFIDPTKFDTTAAIALKFNVIANPAQDAYTNDVMQAAAALNK